MIPQRVLYVNHRDNNVLVQNKPSDNSYVVDVHRNLNIDNLEKGDTALIKWNHGNGVLYNFHKK